MKHNIALLLLIVLSSFSACLSDIRTSDLKSAMVTTNQEKKGRELLVAMA
jgi:hypothetical protein